MNDTVTITVRLYGAFRPYGNQIAVPALSGASVADIKTALRQSLPDSMGGLVLESAIANDREILPDHHIIGKDEVLSVLPPVCGG
jgi:hypothetical protein